MWSKQEDLCAGFPRRHWLHSRNEVTQSRYGDGLKGLRIARALLSSDQRVEKSPPPTFKMETPPIAESISHC